MSFTKRTIVDYNLPLPKDTLILKPEFARVRFPNGKSVDLGSLCYLRREASPFLWISKSPKGRNPDGRRVDLSSLNAGRTDRVRALISHVSDNFTQSGRREITLLDHTTRFIVFMTWVDENGFHDVLNDVETARLAVRGYAQHIRERVNANHISINSGARQQATVIAMLGEFLEVDTLARGINLLRIMPNSKEPTLPPDEDAQAKVLGLCTIIFDGLTTLAIDNKPYPYALAVPPHLNYQDNTLWVFPTTIWFMSPQMLSIRKTSAVPRWAFNYSEGRLATLEELQAIPNYACDNDVVRIKVIGTGKRQLKKANSDPRYSQRLNQGMQALNSFILLFLAQTGMNWAQLINLTWSEDYEVSATHQVFRTIKWRADNRQVSFELPLAFMPKFKRYLELRKYLLAGRPCDWLFFKLGSKGEGEPTQLKYGLTPTYQTLQRIDPSLPAVMSRQWRAAKSDWLIRNTDPSTTALVLQNTERTVLSSYAAGSETTHLEELSSFLDKISETVVAKGHIIKGGISRAVGVCSDYGNPHQSNGPSPVQSDCKGPEGCLFCDKFKVHADEIDIRKLISCRYCLRQTASLADSEERYHALLTPIFNRIEAILNEISQRDAALVLKVTKEVEEDGELEPYWARKVEMLMDLGLVR